MADSPNSGNKIGPPKEMSMEMRLLLALLLTVPILFLGPYLLGPQSPAAGKEKRRAAAAASRQLQPGGSNLRASPAAGSRAAAAAGSGSRRNRDPSSRPALVRHRHRSLPHRLHQPGRDGAELAAQGKKYHGNDGKQLDLVNSAAGLDAALQSRYSQRQSSRNRKLNWTYYTQTADPDGLGVTYQFSDGHVAVKKTFRFEKNSYLSRVSTELTVDGKPLPN